MTYMSIERACFIAGLRGKTVEDRIWYFLMDIRQQEVLVALAVHESLFKGNIELHRIHKMPYNGPENYEEYEAEHPLKKVRAESFNEYFFLEVLCEDLIKSGKDRFKSIRIALRKLTDGGDIVKEINKFGEPVYHFRESGPFSPRKSETKETDQEKRIRELYNAEFDQHIPPDWKAVFMDPKNRYGGLPETSALHFTEFMEASLKLIGIYKEPDKYITMKDRIENRKVFPKVHIYYE